MLGSRSRAFLATRASASRGVAVVVLVMAVGATHQTLSMRVATTAFLHPNAVTSSPFQCTRRPTKTVKVFTSQRRRGWGVVPVPRRRMCNLDTLCLASFDLLDGEEDNLPGSSRETAEPRSPTASRTILYDLIQDDATSARLLRIPIFPLRKSVRLPTEILTLNLYETRYLALAEQVLQLPKRDENDATDEGIGAVVTSSSSSPPSATTTPALADTRGLFGALYAGSCPQIVPANRQRKKLDGGSAALAPPVTPLVQPGDVGVVFGVESFQDGYVPTYGSVPRRRIRLVARGLARFRVDRIVENGYGSDSATPYIVVEARVLTDAPLSKDGNEQAEFDRRIRSACTKLFGMPPDEYLALNRLVPSSEDRPQWKSGEVDGTARARELASFAVASKAMELAGTAQDVAARTGLLRLDDPLERLRRVVR
jgi:Lon protease-like protein